MPLEELQAKLGESLSAFPEVILGYLFGSRVLEHFGPLSDVDVAVLLDVEAEASVLGASLSHHLASILPNAAVDVVILNQAPIELA